MSGFAFQPSQIDASQPLSRAFDDQAIAKTAQQVVQLAQDRRLGWQSFVQDEFIHFVLRSEPLPGSVKHPLQPLVCHGYLDCLHGRYQVTELFVRRCGTYHPLQPSGDSITTA